MYLLKFYLPLILPEEQTNLKISNIPGSTVYIDNSIIIELQLLLINRFENYFGFHVNFPFKKYVLFIIYNYLLKILFFFNVN